MKKKIYAYSILVSVAILTACTSADVPITDTTPSVTPEGSVSANAAHTLSETEEALLNYETKYHSGDFTQEDYYALATIYKEQGMLRKQRDLLEQCYRLYGDESSYLTLQKITVNIAEEEEALQQEANLLLQNLTTADYFGESIHQIEDPQWMALFMPKLKEGIRSYYLEEDGQLKLVIQAGYDEKGKAFSTIWHHGERDSMVLLKHFNGIVQVLNTSMINNIYEGPFTLTLLDGVTGSIAEEQGTFINGIYNGEYTLKLSRSDASGDPYDLWNNRENRTYTTYTAKADEQGLGELEQFASKLEAYPAFTTYVPTMSNTTATNSTDSNTPQIRIYDGEIQWWNGQIWQSIGNTSQYQKEDPFYLYEQQWEQTGADNTTDEGLDWDHISIPRPKPSKPSSPPVKQPSVQTPAPAPAPAPTPTPAPEPEYDDNDDDDDEPASDPEPDNSGSSDDGSNDADVEWTPDIM